MAPPDAHGVTSLPAQPCPLCGTPLDAAGAYDGTIATPAPGDWTWLVFQDGGALRPMTDREWLACSQDERVQLTAQRERVRRAWAARPQP